MADKLLAQTGSSIDAVGQRCYRYLLTQPAHARGVLQMMAAWDLQTFARELPRLAVPVQMQIGLNDGTIPPGQADQAAQLLPQVQRSPIYLWNRSAILKLIERQSKELSRRHQLLPSTQSPLLSDLI